MKIKVTQSVLDYEGKPQISGEGGKELTWRSVITTALNTTIKDESMTGADKARAYLITVKIHSTEEPDLDLGERSFVLDRIEKVFISPLVYGRAKEFFEEK